MYIDHEKYFDMWKDGSQQKGETGKESKTVLNSKNIKYQLKLVMFIRFGKPFMSKVQIC